MRLRALAVAAVSALAGLAGFAPAKAVVNGTSAADGEFPFMASLQYQSDDFAFCGGSVVASGWVLTAAHCVDGHKLDKEPLQVVVGRTRLSDTSKGEEIPVAEIRVHPKYDSSAMANDVALLKLARATSAPTIRLAAAADDDLEIPGTRVTVAGWGDRFPTLGLFATDDLRSAELKVVGDAECGQTNIGFDAPTGVCAEELLKDSCQGDSGGPLWGVKNGERIQIGVVSYGTSCAIPEFPGVYSELNNPGIESWIAGTLNGTTGGPTQGPKKPRNNKG
ncbi:MAG TPA: serine protease [Acidimicrobiales bacterium]|nr:serine protease [Acidimicrobiales bacterium]